MKRIMAIIDYIPLEEANGERYEILSQFKEEHGQSPLIYEALIHNPEVVRARYDYFGTIMNEGELPRELKELVYVVVSQTNECRYCAINHSKILDEVLDGDSELVTKLQDGSYEQLSEEKRKVAGLAQKVAEHPDQVSESDIKELGEFGFTTSEIIELISTASLAVSSNIVVDTLSISLSNKEEHPSSM
jgi:uncharacterized peroxidase-related enzyme